MKRANSLLFLCIVFLLFCAVFFFFFSQNKQTEIKTIPIIFPPHFGIATLLH